MFLLLQGQHNVGFMHCIIDMHSCRSHNKWGVKDDMTCRDLLPWSKLGVKAWNLIKHNGMKNLTLNLRKYLDLDFKWFVWSNTGYKLQNLPEFQQECQESRNSILFPIYYKLFQVLINNCLPGFICRLRTQLDLICGALCWLWLWPFFFFFFAYIIGFDCLMQLLSFSRFPNRRVQPGEYSLESYTLEDKSVLFRNQLLELQGWWQR